MSTPKTANRYLKTPQGTAYGFKQNHYLKGSRTPRKSKVIKNMFYASSWGFPGGGFTDANDFRVYDSYRIFYAYEMESVYWYYFVCCIRNYNCKGI
ncbi:MAG: hypothetical protein ACRCV0_01635 [Brevinema sp.]